MSRVVVVGAGVGALAAAARLAWLGHRVTVCEAAPVVGGKLGRAEVVTPAGRFVFDTGPSVLTVPQVFRDLFAQTGGDLDSAVALREVDPPREYRFADGSRVTITRERAEQARRFDAEFGTGCGAAWSALMARAERMWRASEQPVLRSALTPRTALVRATRFADLAAVRPWQSLRSVGLRMLPEPRLRMILDRYATYAGSDPRRAPAALAVIPYLESEFGCWTVEGGLARLAAALAAHAAALGVQVRTSCRVNAIDVAGGRVHAVALADGSRIAADVVVSDADASCLYGTLLGSHRPPPADSSAGFVLLLGLRGTTPLPARDAVLFGAADVDAEFDALFARPGRLVPDPMIYLSRSTDPACCPPGHETWFVMVNAPRHGPGGIDWDEPGVADAYASRVLDLMAARGAPVRERLLFRQVRTPADLERSASAPGGSIYGSAMHGPLAPWRRPRNAARVRGLYLVGGSAHPGGGLPLVALSAEIVAGLAGPAG